MASKYTLTPKQTTAYKLLTSTEDCAVCYGGAKGGGKSFLFCLWAFQWCNALIRFFDLNEPLKHPLPVGFIGRKRAVDFNKTTLETWKRVIPPEAYIIREQDKEIIINGRVKMGFGGLDDQENINKFNSAELAFVAIDQGEETEESDLGTLEASLRLKHNGRRPPYKKLYTANPAECHLKYRFIKARRSGEYFVPALPSDNPHLPKGYVATLESSFAYDKKLLRAYRDGDWDALLPSNQLITFAMLDGVKGINFLAPVAKKIISCDPSMGGDECVIKVFYNSVEVEQKIMHERDTMKIAGELAVMSHKHQCDDFIIDTIGIGQGIVDRLSEMGMRVNAFNSAESADDSEHFANRKAEAWAYVAQQITDKKTEYPTDEETVRQLVECHYKIINSNGRLQLEPKAEVKKRIGRSPDRADAYIMGIYGLSKIADNVVGVQGYGDRQGQGERVNAESETMTINVGSGY
jgi:hypothetical protein